MLIARLAAWAASPCGPSAPSASRTVRNQRKIVDESSTLNCTSNTEGSPVRGKLDLTEGSALLEVDSESASALVPVASGDRPGQNAACVESGRSRESLTLALEDSFVDPLAKGCHKSNVLEGSSHNVKGASPHASSLKRAKTVEAELVLSNTRTCPASGEAGRGNDASSREERIKWLHRYNETRDAATILLGKLANIEGCTVKELYTRYAPRVLTFITFVYFPISETNCLHFAVTVVVLYMI